VLDIHKKDFRDPKVFWYDKGKKWIMAVVLPHVFIPVKLTPAFRAS
jgi:sucrose-6-phosphate hydrolase SacC (GH32 family)